MPSDPSPAVFVPGFPASVLIDTFTGSGVIFPPRTKRVLSVNSVGKLLRRLYGPNDPEEHDGVIAGGPIPRAMMSDQAQSLYDILRGFGYVMSGESHLLYPVGWDWRRPVYGPDTLARVKGAILRMHRLHGRPVNLIVHSTGGLVFRELVRREPGLRPYLRKVVAIGVPWAGTLKSMRGIALGDGLIDFKLGEWRLGKKRVRAMIGRAWAAYDLLPPDPTYPESEADRRPPALVFDRADEAVAPLRRTDWLEVEDRESRLPRARAADAALGRRGRDFLTGDWSDLELVNLLAWGANTEVRADIGARAKVTFKRSDASWEASGDGTIPTRSAAWIGGARVRSFPVPFGTTGHAATGKHSQLWKAEMAKAVLEDALLERPFRPHFVYASADPDDMLRKRKQVRVRVSAVDAEGRALPGAQAMCSQRKYGGSDPGERPIDPVTGTVMLHAQREVPWGRSRTYRNQVEVRWIEDGHEHTETVNLVIR